MKKTVLLFFIILSQLSMAQEKMSTDSTAVKSIDGIVKEVLRILSGEAGKQRNWTDFRNLFLPTAGFTILNHDATFPQPVERATLDEFINLLQDPYYEKGFLEIELHKTVDEYNGIAQVFQTYYSKDSEQQEEKGITSYQLVYFNSRWWIVSVLWTGNSNGVAIPDKYMGN